MKRSYFKRKPTKPLKRTRLRVKGHSTTAQLKDQIQSTARKIVIIRDDGCLLKDDGRCTEILQCEHLITRSNTKTFADLRNLICLCTYHHLFYKKQHSRMYWDRVREKIGEQRWAWLKRVEEDRTPYKVDLKLELLALEQEYKKLCSTS